MGEQNKSKNDRISSIIDVIMRVARGDFSVQAELSGTNDAVDSLALGINMMIDDVKEKHEALKESEAKFKAQYKGIPVPTYTWQWSEIRGDFVLTDYNDAARTITKGDIIDFIGINAREMYGDRPDILDDLSQCFTEKSVIKREMTLEFKKSGRVKHLSVTYVYVPPALVMVHTEDITERKRTEEEMLFKNVLLETQKESSIDGILAVDNEGKVISYNKRFIGMWEIPAEVIDKKDVSVLRQHVSGQLQKPDEFIKKIEYLYAHKQEKSRDEILLKDGRTIDRYSAPLISPSGEHFGRIWFFSDITEKKAMQEKLMRQERLAVLGQLAGGIGHELRNPLGAIKNAAYFLNLALEEPAPEVKETLDILDKEVANSERIISSLLDFARARPPRTRKTNIGEIMQEVLSRLNIPESIEVNNRIIDSIPGILADPDQLSQVFGNILLNSIQAMRDGGQLVIRCETQDPAWLTISITDTGVGIPAENLPEIFEPLFTGKAKGIGLGMAITKTFVEGHGGSIAVESEPGKGTTVSVKLPVNVKGAGN